MRAPCVAAVAPYRYPNVHELYPGKTAHSAGRGPSRSRSAPPGWPCLPPRSGRSAEAVAGVRLVPVGLVRLDPDAPGRVVEEARCRAGPEPGDRREIRGLAERRPLVEVPGVVPQDREVDQPALADLPARVLPEIEPGQRRPQPDVGLGQPTAEQVALAGQPP